MLQLIDESTDSHNNPYRYMTKNKIHMMRGMFNKL